ncbi:MAG: AI-2E family transporter [Parcubacteria group bacterium]|nr:AI-2E family transporter [Parcubacteria group bacterium]
MGDKNTLEISWGSFLRLAAIIITGALFFTLSNVVTMLVFSVVLASAFDPFVNRLYARGWPRIAIVLFLYISAFILLAAAVYYLAPLVFSELRSFITLVGGTQSPVLKDYGNITYLISLLEHFESISTKDIATLFSRVGSLVASLFGGVASMFIVIVITFYLLLHERGVGDFIADIAPLKYEPYVLDVWQRTQNRIGKWLQAQIGLSVLIGVLVFLGLTLLGVSNALLLGVLAALLEIVPVVGPIVAGGVAMLVALGDSSTLALYTGAVFIGIQQFESHILIPILMKKAVGLNPVFVLVLLLAGANLGGLVGVFLAVPIGVLLEEIVKDMIEKKRRI